MIIVCTGGLTYNNYAAVYAALDMLHSQYGVETVHVGCALGADECVRAWAQERGVLLYVHKAKWEELGPRAGNMRNIEMLVADPRPTYCVAFPGGKETAHMIRQCEVGAVTIWKPYGVLV